MPEAVELQAARQTARTVAWFAAASLAMALFWFAYVDAPLVDPALMLFAGGAASAAVAIIAALLSIEATLAAPAGMVPGTAERRAVRARRLALLCLAIALLLLLTSATLTLSLQGPARDAQADTGLRT